MAGKQDSSPSKDHVIFERPDETAGRSSADLSLVEWAALDMARCVFVGFADVDSDGVGAAMARGDWHFCAGHSGPIVSALSDCLAAMRSVRRSPFRFSDPRCPCCRPRVTDCEMGLIRLLRARMQGRDGDFVAAALMLCDGACTEPFLRAAARAADQLNDAVLRKSAGKSALH